MDPINKKIILGGIIFLILIIGAIFLYINKEKVILSLTQTDNDDDDGEINLSQTQTLQPENQQQLTQTSTKEENENIYTMEEVIKHNSKESCWSVIRGNVYDLTRWIDKHPGGPDKILKICGKDGTDLFVKQHGGKEKQEKILESFKIGVLRSQ